MMFRIICTVDPQAFRKRYKVEPKATRFTLLEGPFTHEQACTVMRKHTVYDWRHLSVEPIE